MVKFEIIVLTRHLKNRRGKGERNAEERGGRRENLGMLSSCIKRLSLDLKALFASNMFFYESRNRLSTRKLDKG